MTLRSAADDEIALTLASPIGMGEGILDPSYPRPPCGRVPCRHSAVFSNECARITRDLDFKIINLVIFESSFENLAGVGAYAASAIGESSTPCPSSRSLRTW